MNAHFEHLEENVLKNALDTFYWIRSVKDVRKKPSTSELIDWIRALLISGMDTERLREELPFLGVLLKKDEDLEAVKKAKLY